MRSAAHPSSLYLEHLFKTPHRWRYALGMLFLVGVLAGTFLPIYGCITNDPMALTIGIFLWVGGLFGGRHIASSLLGDKPDAVPLFLVLGGDLLSGMAYLLTRNLGHPCCIAGYLLGIFGWLLTFEDVG